MVQLKRKIKKFSSACSLYLTPISKHPYVVISNDGLYLIRKCAGFTIKQIINTGASHQEQIMHNLKNNIQKILTVKA